MQCTPEPFASGLPYERVDVPDGFRHPGASFVDLHLFAELDPRPDEPARIEGGRPRKIDGSIQDGQPIRSNNRAYGVTSCSEHCF